MMYSLNEVGIIPSRSPSYIYSRMEIDPFYEGKLPIFVAPMTCVLNDENFKIFQDSKVIPIHPRKLEIDLQPSDEWQALSLEQFIHYFCGCSAPEGTGSYKILIDVANGHMKKLYDAVEDAKQEYPNLTVMIGNIASPEMYIECCKHHVDYVRVGIGGGSACTTGVQTGIHASLPWLLTEIQNLKKEKSIIQGFSTKISFKDYCKENKWTLTKIIADGGINTIDKAIKCLALGADYVMMGKMFAQCEEACGEKDWFSTSSSGTKRMCRKYYGMASEQGQIDISGGAIKNPEGISTYVEINTTLYELTNKFEAALRSCMSYCGISSLSNFIGAPQIEYMTAEEFKSYYK